MADMKPIPSSDIFDDWAIKVAKLIRWSQSSEEITVALKSEECPDIPRALRQGVILARLEELTDKIVAEKLP